MTHTSTEQPDAEKLALIYEGGCAIDKRVAAELRRQRARILELEASQAQRVPLNEAQRIEVCTTATTDFYAGKYGSIQFAVLDHTQRAHGITQEKQG